MNPRPDALVKEQLVEMTGLSARVVRVWFQNKRCKDKKKSLEVKLQLQQEKVCVFVFYQINLLILVPRTGRKNNLYARNSLNCLTSNQTRVTNELSGLRSHSLQTSVENIFRFCNAQRLGRLQYAWLPASRQSG